MTSFWASGEGVTAVMPRAANSFWYRPERMVPSVARMPGRVRPWRFKAAAVSRIMFRMGTPMCSCTRSRKK